VRALGLRSFIAVVAVAVVVSIGGGLSDVSASSAAKRPPARALKGAWVVRQDSVVGYRARELLFGAPAPHDVVGRTSVVSGRIGMSGVAMATATVSADLRTLQSNDGTRDADLRGRYFNAHPTASFKLGTPIPLGGIRPGQVRAVDATGALTIHGVTKEATFTLKLRYNGPTFEVVGSTRVKMTDFAMEPPSEAQVATISDAVTIEVQVVLVRKAAR
jgi:polyisoprenoid-binding protein YceI